MENKWLVLGPVAMAVLCLMVFLAIAFSPWFMWQSNALSDLGNPYNGAIAAAVFNLGLGASGFMLLAYSLKSLKFQARKASLMLAVTGFFLFMVGALNESYGQIHAIVSVIMFISLLSSSILYFVEKKSMLAMLAMLGMFSWFLYFGKVTGAAVPETTSWLTSAPWIIISAKSAYYMKRTK